MQNGNNPQAIIRGLKIFEAARQKHAGGDHAGAAALYKQALALMPDHPSVLVEYGRLAEDVGDWHAAERIYRRIGELRPQSNFEGRLGHALFKLERYAEAIPWFDKHVARHPGEANILYALSICHSSTGNWEAGLACARRAWTLKPVAQVLDPLLNALYHLGCEQELDEEVQRAIRRFPDSPEIRSIYSMHKLTAGDCAEGFRYFTDFRWRNNLAVPSDGGTPGEWWDGRQFDGTLLVTAEQGLGDEIMVSSVFGDLVAMGQPAIIECDERLLPVYSRSFPTLRFVPRHRQQLAAAHAGGGTFRKINGLDMVGVFRRSGTFPARHSWLVPDPARSAALRAGYEQRWPGRKRIGISWKSSRVLEGGGTKNMQLDDFAPLFALPDAALVSLQYGEVAADIDRLRTAGLGELFVDPAVDPASDIDGLFAQVAALDVVVSTSNTTVHIAGALGIPCLLLLPGTRPTLWYWGYAGERTPWYPSIRIIRNSRENDCRELFAAVVAQLATTATAGIG